MQKCGEKLFENYHLKGIYTAGHIIDKYAVVL
jgi:hypothetical protein